MYRSKAAYNDGMASRATRRRRPGCASSRRPARRRRPPREQNVTMRLRGGRTGKRAVVCEQLELTGLMKPFDLEVWFGERVAVLGLQRLRQVALPAAAGRRRQRPGRRAPSGRRRADRAGRPPGRGAAGGAGAARLVRADPRAPRAGRAHAARRPVARRRRTATGMGREQASRALDRYELAEARRADLRDAVRRAAGAVPDPAARAVRRDAAAARRADRQPRPGERGGARGGPGGLRGHGAGGHARPVVRPRRSTATSCFGADGGVYESAEPVWDEGRVVRAR